MINDIETAEKLFSAMEKMESAMALYYRECYQAFANEYDFFHDIELQELAHEKNIVFTLDEIKNKPEEFSRKMPIDETTVLESVDKMMLEADKIRENQRTLKEALNIALTEEKTVMEKNYSDVIEAKDKKIKQLFTLIADETEIHYEEIE